MRSAALANNHHGCQFIVRTPLVGGNPSDLVIAVKGSNPMVYSESTRCLTLTRDTFPLTVRGSSATVTNRRGTL